MREGIPEPRCGGRRGRGAVRRCLGGCFAWGAEDGAVSIGLRTWALDPGDRLWLYHLLAM